MAEADPRDLGAVSIGRLARLQLLVTNVRAGIPDLTQRQIAILMTLCWVRGPHGVKEMAAALGVSKPVVTRAFNSLSSLGLMKRTYVEQDRRLCFGVVTEAGRALAERLAG